MMGFPGGSVGKESVFNTGDTGDMGLIPGWERSPRGGHDHPFQYSWLEEPIVQAAAMVHKRGREELPHVRGQGVSARRSYPTSEVRGGSWEELPRV